MSEKEIQILKNGDQKAWSKFIKEYGELMWKYCLRYYRGDYDNASDAYQEVLIKIFRKINLFGEDLNKYQFNSWIKKLVWRTCQDYRKNKSFPSISAKHDIVELDEHHAYYYPHDEIKDLYNHAMIAINKLPSKQKTAVKMFADQGFSHPEIAKKMKTNVETVRSNYHRGRMKVAKLLTALSLLFFFYLLPAQEVQFKTGDYIIYAETLKDTVKQYRVDFENDYWGLVSILKELKKNGNPYLVAALDWKGDSLYEMFDKPVPIKFRDDHYYIKMIGFERIDEIKVYTRNRIFIFLTVQPFNKYL